MKEDPRLEEAHAIPMADVIARLDIAGLVRTGSEMVGPCPICGGRDRFGINLQTGVFQCRKQCGANSRGDQVSLVQHVLGMDFKAALDWLCGPAEGISDAEREKRRRRAEENRRRQQEISDRARASSIQRAREIWFAGRPAENTPVRDYLTRRGITRELLPDLPKTIRFDPEARYTIPKERAPGQWEVLHTGPAMLCAVSDPENRVTAVHRTWLDLDQPKGKLVLADPRKPGDNLPAKKVLGSKKGGAIRFATPKGASQMIMGEGPETSLSALVLDMMTRSAAVWCGVDLGNMSGRMERGPGLKYAGRPDMSDREAWLPPAWVKHLIFVQDGDSDPRLTRAKLEAGLRRAMLHRPGLTTQIVHPGEGIDLNDVLMGDANEAR